MVVYPDMKALWFFIQLGIGFWLSSLCLALSVSADTDIGNIAIIEAGPTILQPGELFDLNNQTLTFTPLTDGGYTVSAGSLNFNANLCGYRIYGVPIFFCRRRLTLTFKSNRDNGVTDASSSL